MVNRDDLTKKRRSIQIIQALIDQIQLSKPISLSEQRREYLGASGFNIPIIVGSHQITIHESFFKHLAFYHVKI